MALSRRGRVWRTAVVMLAAHTAHGGPTAYGQAPATGLTIEDMLGREEVGEAELSPDGASLAVTIKRGNIAPAGGPYARSSTDGERGDVWIVPRSGGAPRNLTNGIADGSWNWDPVWSPDGTRLALLSTKGGDNVRMYVWDRATGTMRRVSDRGVDLWTTMEPAPRRGQPMRWVDDSTLLCAVLPPGAVPWQFVAAGITPMLAGPRWQQATRGVSPTSSVVESGSADTAGSPSTPEAQLVLARLGSGRVTVLADGAFRSVIVSSDGSHLVAESDVGPATTMPAGSRSLWHRRGRLVLVSLRTPSPPVWVRGVFADVEFEALSSGSRSVWSPDGATLAVLGKLHDADADATVLWTVDARTGAASRVLGTGWSARAVTWSGDGHLVALATSPSDTDRAEWWIVRGTPHRLAGATPLAPATLIPGAAPSVLLGAAGGTVWQFDVSRHSATDLLVGDVVHGTVAGIAWPSQTDVGIGTTREIVIGTRQPGMPASLFRVALDGPRPRMVAMPRPSTGALLRIYRPDLRWAAYSGTHDIVTYVWGATTVADMPAMALITLNAPLAARRLGAHQWITYRGADGDTLHASVVLPVDYQPGRRYPVITSVYPGIVYRDTTPTPWRPASVAYLEPQLWAARGYVVLMPSIPLEGSDPYLEIPKGVLPAVDRLVELGIADPGRIGVYGQSFGGYCVYALVAYTHRFRAAAALAGFADMPAWYGSWDIRIRYLDHPTQDGWWLFSNEELETMLGGATPWRNLWVYLRNSPYFLLDRVETPLLIMQGDQDYVPIEQGEQVFAGLYRLGKRARFVRYWGEGHLYDSPANIRDAWARMAEWFDTELAP